MAPGRPRKAAKVARNSTRGRPPSGAPPKPRAARAAPARRARADGRETRARVLDAAAEVFARDGFEGASLRRIAETAGIDIATLKYHVRDKPALFAEVYRDGFEHFQQALGPLLMRLPLARDADELLLELRKLFERGYDYLEGNRRFVRLWLFRLLQGPREVLEAEETIRVHVTSLIQAAVEVLRERGLVRELDVPVLALFMVTTFPTLALGAQARPGLLGTSELPPRERFIDFAVELVRNLVVWPLDGGRHPA
jgi:AcrR family transcriptional regulator